MGFLDRLFGRTEEPARRAEDVPPAAPAADEDERAIERYRYLLRTAPPEQIEQAHAEAFSKLTPEQRRQVLSDLSDTVPPQERAASDDPRDLARMATRAEVRRPGTLERSLGRGGPGSAAWWPVAYWRVSPARSSGRRSRRPCSTTAERTAVTAATAAEMPGGTRAATPVATSAAAATSAAETSAGATSAGSEAGGTTAE